MALWMVRAGSDGETEDFALENNVAVVGWHEVRDLSQAESRDDLAARLRATFPDQGEHTTAHWARQLWTFAHRIQPGDLIALPLKSQPAIAFGRVTGGYRYDPTNPPGTHHTRPVEWIRTDVPRSALDKDLLYSLGAYMTVCQIKRNNAEERIRALLEGRQPTPSPAQDDDIQDDLEAAGVPVNLAQHGRDLIRERISQRFKGHRFERLVEHLLIAQGYVTERTTEGADGGADIVAGRGAMGFDQPRIAVQVKSTDTPEGENAIRELQGVLKRFGATQGLFVSWAGYKTSVHRRRRELFFEVRLWDADDVIDSLIEHYDKLPDEIRTEIPITRVWTIAD
jgi:restriction system protein